MVDKCRELVDPVQFNLTYLSPRCLRVKPARYSHARRYPVKNAVFARYCRRLLRLLITDAPPVDPVDRDCQSEQREVADHPADGVAPVFAPLALFLSHRIGLALLPRRSGDLLEIVSAHV